MQLTFCYIMFIRSRCGRPAPNRIYDNCQYLKQKRLMDDHGKGAKEDNLPSATLCIVHTAMRSDAFAGVVQYRCPTRGLSAVHSPYKRCLGTRWSDGVMERKRRMKGAKRC